MLQQEDVLIQKLDNFIRKYYKNRVVKGLIYSVAIIGVFFLIVVLLEYFGRFSPKVRGFILFSYLGLTGVVLVRFILIPFFHLLKIGRVISYNHAAEIIGNHFSDVGDKLLNTLQLRESLKVNSTSNVQLLEASIDQKISNLKPISFGNAIDFKSNLKYLKYAVIPLIVIFGLFSFAPSVVQEGTTRIINYKEEFIPEAPFDFILRTKNLKIIELSDLELDLELMKKEYLPEKVFVEINGKRFLMERENVNSFSYIIKNVKKELKIKFLSQGYESQFYDVSVLPNPVLLNFEVALDFPNYVGRKDEVLKNTGDLVLPEGTLVNWKFKTKTTDKINVNFSDSLYILEDGADNRAFTLSRSFNRAVDYSVITSNSFVTSKDSILYHVEIIKDRFPEIQVSEIIDSLDDKRRYFNGAIKDDYGFRNLLFRYKSKTDKKWNNVSIAISKTLRQDQFYYAWDIESIGLKPGDEIEYLFQVWDNDGVNGSKSAKSGKKYYKAPSLEEVAEKNDEKGNEIKNEIEEGIKQVKKLSQDLNKLQNDLFQKKSMGWQEKNQIEKLLNEQKQLEQRINDIKNLNKERNELRDEFAEVDEKLLEKQKQLEKLFDEILTDEMKKMFEELEKLLAEMHKDRIENKLDDMKLSNQDIEKELDRTLEQFKQLEFEQKYDKMVEDLKDLSKEQMELAKKTKDKETSADELKEEQEKIAEKFEKLEKENEELEKLNEELENKNQMPEVEELAEEIKKEMNEGKENIDKNNNKKAAENQKNAGDKMGEMAAAMDEMMQSQEMQQMTEDLNALRELLENLIQLSFDQESIMTKLGKLRRRDPRFVELSQAQKKIKDDAQIVEDSLFALSKRIIQLEAVINKEINAVNFNMAKAIESMADRNTSKATGRQQYVMTSMNNLALLLDEALRNVQEMMANSMPGNGSCNKPGGKGGKKQSMSSMKQMQKEISEQIKRLKGQMEKEGKNGKKPGRGSGMSKEMAKLAAKQSAIREQVQKMMQELNKDGKGSGNGLKKIVDQMEKNEEDIVNWDLNIETLKRQQDIMTRLLEAEKAERERELDDKRTAEEAKEPEISNPENFLKYKQLKEKELELLKTIPVNLKPYYKEKVNEYFNNFVY